MVENHDIDPDEVEAQIEADADHSEELRQQELDDVKFVMSTAAGRRFMWRYLSECGVYQDPLSFDTNEVFFLKGRRSIGLSLTVDIHEADLDLYTTMQKEAAFEEEVLSHAAD